MQTTIKLIISGSLGSVSQPLTGMLVRNGHHVTVSSSDPAKAAPIQHLRATAISAKKMQAEYERLGMPVTLAKRWRCRRPCTTARSWPSFGKPIPHLGRVKLAAFAQEGAVAYHAH